MKQNHRSRSRNLLVSIFVLSCAVGSVAATALELGTGQLKSAPGAPLDVEIPLLQIGEGELETLKPLLPANSRSSELASATVELANSADGAPILRVRSSAPVNAENIRFVVVADWGRGRRFREYNFSLAVAESASPAAAAKTSEAPSPAVTTLSTSGGSGITGAAEAAPGESISTSSGMSTTVATGETFATSGASTSPSATSAPGSSAPASSVLAASTRRVRAGETLMSISREWSAATGATLSQTMVGIYRANPQAFGPGGMSELLVNAELSLPDAATLKGTSSTVASGEVSRALGIWRTAGAPATAPAVEPRSLAAPPATASAAPRTLAAPPAKAPIAAAPVATAPVAPETVEAKAARLELALNEKTAALDASTEQIAALQSRIAAYEAAAAAAAAKEKPSTWLTKAQQYAALAWWSIPALLLTVLVLLLALLLKGRRKASSKADQAAAESAGAAFAAAATAAAAADPEVSVSTTSAREMTFELPPIKPTRTEPAVTATAAAPSSVVDLEGDPPPIDEAGSKIDLARAFIEMGHHDAAILELQAALRIGDERQRAEAIRLLDSLPKS